MTTRLGFIGAGGIVRGALAPAAHAADGVVVQAVAARDLARAQALEPAGRAYDDYTALLEDPDVDLVYVALDNAGHLPWTLAALAAGKHVICEKPLGLSPAEVERMTRAAAEADRLLVEAFWYRWHPRTRRLEQLLRQGALGEIRQVESVFSFNGPAGPGPGYRLDPARGGGGLYDVGCYALSLAHLALGPGFAVDSVDVHLGPTGVDLRLDAVLSTVAGTGGTVGAGSPDPVGRATIGCGICAPDRQVISVAGEAATATFGPPAFTAKNVPVELSIGTPDGAVRQEGFAPVDPYRLMIEAVAARTRGEDAFVIDRDHSIRIARTTAAVRQYAL